MPAPIDDSLLQGVLESRRGLFFQGLATDLTATEREQQWAAYILSLSQPSALPNTQSLEPPTADATEKHAASSPTAPPETKKRRLNTDASHHIRRVPSSRPHSSSLPPSHASGCQDGPSPFVNTGARVPTPVLSHWSTTSIPEKAQEPPHNLESLSIPQPRGSTARKIQSIPVQEYQLTDLFGPSSQQMSANSSSMGQTFDQSPSTLQPFPFLSSSPHSSVSDTSFGVSTNPTSAGMSRMDSLAGTSFHHGFDMLRLDSRPLKAARHQRSFSSASPMEAHHSPNFKPSEDVSAQPVDHMYDISLTGAQFNDPVFSAAAPAMERQKSSRSRQLHPKPAVPPSMSRTPSSADGHDVIRVPSSDGSFKEAIKISPTTSYIRPSSDKVMCTQEGCTAQPHGFKGEHEMRRHFDRAHKPARQVYVCAPLADDPNFLSRTKCKHCLGQKEYNEDYNAGEHLRRMHFNPKQPKTRRGNLKPEEKRGGKGGGHKPPMEILRDYMITYKVDAKGIRVTDRQKVNPSSNLKMPNISDSGEPSVEEVESTPIDSSIPSMTNLEYSNSDYAYTSEPNSTAQPAIKPRFAGNGLSDYDEAQLGLTAEVHGVINKSQFAGVSNNVDDQVPFDSSNPSVDLHDDPFLFDASHPDTSAPFNLELADFFPFS